MRFEQEMPKTAAKPTLPTGDDVFRAWARLRQSPGQPSPLNDDSVETYRLIWTPWLQHCAARGVDWFSAKPKDLKLFLASRSPASVRRRSDHLAATELTQQRYFRVLTAVYNDLPYLALLPPAATAGHHPIALALPDVSVARARPDSTTLPPGALQALAALLQTPLALQPQQRLWAAQRDRALLAVALDTAATVSELRSLRQHDVLLSPVSGLVRVRVMGSVNEDREKTPGSPSSPRNASRRRQHSQRVLALGHTAAAHLQTWLEVRETLDPKTETLFMSAKGHGPITAVSIWRLISDSLDTALAAAGIEAAERVGPTALRNTVLLSWLDQLIPFDEVARLAGLKSPLALARLVHLVRSEEVRVGFQEHLSKQPVGVGVT
jgi:integrase